MAAKLTAIVYSGTWLLQNKAPALLTGVTCLALIGGLDDQVDCRPLSQRSPSEPSESPPCLHCSSGGNNSSTSAAFTRRIRVHQRSRLVSGPG